MRARAGVPFLPASAATAGVATTALALLAACGEPGAEAEGGDVGAEASLPEVVEIASPGLHPEGIEWDATRGRFLVSSVTQGTVTAVRDGGSTETVAPAVEGAGAIGIHIDGELDRLLVAHADLGVFQSPESRGMARLGVYDLATGARIHLVELGALRPEGRHFANDVTVGSDGTAYVTDSFSPVIYAVTPQGEASVLVEDERLVAEPIGLNGIDHHPDGYLIVAVAGRGALVKVPLDDPSALADVSLPEPLGADGLVFMEDGTLAAVAYEDVEDETADIVWLRSDDDWVSAAVIGRAPAASATTATVREGSVYAVDPHFATMGAGEPHPVFEILRVEPGAGS